MQSNLSKKSRSPYRPSRSAIAACLLLALGCQPDPPEDPPPPPPSRLDPAAPAQEAPGFIYGRVTTHGGAVYTGRLRWGGDEEAFWGETFNGTKSQNPWAEHAPIPERRPVLFGIELPGGERVDTSRPFMARFGDIARIESVGEGVRDLVEEGADYDPTVRVTLKSGTAFDLARLEASDFDDGVRVWDPERGVTDLGPRQIRSIELLPTDALRGAPDRLYGTVQTTAGPFTGFVQWDRERATGADVLVGEESREAVEIPFGSVRRLTRGAEGGVAVEQRDGRERVVVGSPLTEQANKGLYVDDERYGRVLVPWAAFEEVTFDSAGSGPAYTDFPAGRALSGTVTLRSGEEQSGRIVFDLDESETTETLDAPSRGIDYTIPFGLVASVIVPESDQEPIAVQLQNGEALALERSGDLGPNNGGLLVFPSGRPEPQYQAWDSIARIDFDGAAAAPGSE
jgi:hypothetical protein